MLRQSFISLLGTAACSLLINAAPALAYSLNPDLACQLTDVTGASQCSGSYTLGNGENDVTNGGSDNIVSQLLNNDDVFGVGGGWSFDAKDDGGLAGSNSLNFDVTGLNSDSGKFEFGNIDYATTDLAISLKSAKGFSVYYIEAGTLDAAANIDWSTIGTAQNNKGKAKALSHASVYYRFTTDNSPQPQDVPEPASGLALLAIGAVAAKGTLRKKHAA